MAKRAGMEDSVGAVFAPRYEPKKDRIDIGFVVMSKVGKEEGPFWRYYFTVVEKADGRKEFIKLPDVPGSYAEERGFQRQAGMCCLFVHVGSIINGTFVPMGKCLLWSFGEDKWRRLKEIAADRFGGDLARFTKHEIRIKCLEETYKKLEITLCPKPTEALEKLSKEQVAELKASIAAAENYVTEHVTPDADEAQRVKIDGQGAGAPSGARGTGERRMGRGASAAQAGEGSLFDGLGGGGDAPSSAVSDDEAAVDSAIDSLLDR